MQDTSVTLEHCKRCGKFLPNGWGNPPICMFCEGKAHELHRPHDAKATRDPVTPA